MSEDFASNLNAHMLWVDEALLVVNKPAGLRSIRDGYDANLPYLQNMLQERFGRVWVVHRLDKDTSGVIVFARSPEAHRAVNQQFEQRQTRKIYHAIVVGMPEWEELSIALPLRVNGDRKHRTVIDHQAGKPAETIAQVLERLGVFTLLAVSPHTGYTHQIRAHLAAMGLPLLGDRLYHSLQPQTQVDVSAEKIKTQLPMQRTALHAFQITLQHPLSQEMITLEAPYPDDFRLTLEILVSMRKSSNS